MLKVQEIKERASIVKLDEDINVAGCPVVAPCDRTKHRCREASVPSHRSEHYVSILLQKFQNLRHALTVSVDWCVVAYRAQRTEASPRV